MVNVGDVGQGIEVLNLRPVGIVHDRAVLPVRNSQNLLQRLALRELDHGVIKFLAADEIDGRAIFQRLLRQHGDVRAHKSNLDLRDWRLDGLRQPDIAREIRECW